MIKNFEKIKNKNGITSIDIIISIIVIISFTGIFTSLMAGMYEQSLEIQKSAEANAYATMILEKIDEKPYDDVNEVNDFIEYLGDELEINDNYDITVDVEPLAGYEQDILKKATVTIEYSVNGENKKIKIEKLKIREIGV